MRRALVLTLSVISILLYISLSRASKQAMQCNARAFGEDSFVCVCDGDFCDVMEEVMLPTPGTFKRIVSSRDEHRFTILSEDENDSSEQGDVTIKIDYSKTYQSIIGFGGAFSDATGIVVSSLSKSAQENLMRSYFSKDGIAYNLCRIPIGGTDFSLRPYSYDDDFENDVDLEHFALAKEDFEYKIPLIKKAQELSGGQIRFFASMWSPPAWMKDNGKLNGKGGLLREMWTPYSNYLIRFIEEYKKNNISLWGLSTVNEPTAGFHDWPWNACAWPAEDMRDWIKTNFGPAIERANMRYLKVMVHDQSRKTLSTYPVTILRDSAANRYVDGIGLHWYDDEDYSPQVMDDILNEFSDKFLLNTESCEGVETHNVLLGSWRRGERYASQIIENINHFSSGWVDWNMALNMQGGPSWVKNYVDSPIIVNEEADEFYKQPMFYVLGHFSKFVLPGSKRLKVQMDPSNQIQAAAFIVPKEGSIVVVILNKNEEEKRVVIQAPSKNLNIKMNAKSIESIIFNANVEEKSRIEL